jgi:hypothetical protein
MSTTDPATPRQPPDPVDLLDRLDADSIRERMAALDAERRALAVLLRAAATRERARREGAANA